MIRIIVAEDHHVVRQGLLALLNVESDFDVIGETGDGNQALALTKELKPDVLLLDLSMPGLDGFHVTEEVTKTVAPTAVVILSMYSDEPHVLQAFRNGAMGYVLKNSLPVHLPIAIREAAARHHYLSPPLSERAIRAYTRGIKSTPLDLYDTLTPREREILNLIAEGKTSAQMAIQLQISRRTGQAHRASLMKKLQLRTQIEVLRFAMQKGIVQYP
jgi:DNA-binding NarL/FixJ family response regulator